MILTNLQAEILLNSVLNIINVGFNCLDYHPCSECPLCTRHRDCLFDIIRDTIDIHKEKEDK